MNALLQAFSTCDTTLVRLGRHRLYDTLGKHVWDLSVLAVAVAVYNCRCTGTPLLGHPEVLCVKSWIRSNGVQNREISQCELSMVFRIERFHCVPPINSQWC